uniref:Senescence regulator S40 n=1 Tax=Opuntia streptacantha TaxID=393608 RepID=A0A7C9DP40_OPUST
MEINGVSNYRHRRSPSSDRFLGLFSPSGDRTSIVSGHELNEAEIFWTGADSDDSSRGSTSPVSRRKLGFRRPEESGILAAITDDDQNRIVLPSTTPFRAIPKPPPGMNQSHRGEFTQSAPLRKFQNSAPIKVPPPAMMKPRRFNQMDSLDDEDDNDEEMLPPHEIVAMKLKSTSSVLEGVGRTLKGRDLRQVRNAVWRQTGFLD